MANFQQNIVILFYLFIALGIPIRGNCDKINLVDDITVQGTEVITKLFMQIDTCIIDLEKGELNEAKLLIEQIMNSWNIFTEKEKTVFKEELERSEQLENIVANTSTDIDQVANHIGTKETAPATILLHKIKKNLEDLLSLIRQPVLLAFIGPRCTSWPDCETGDIMKDRVNSIAHTFEGDARIVFIDVKKNKGLARKYNILFVPTLVFIHRAGTERYRKVGELDELSIRTELFDLLEGN